MCGLKKLRSTRVISTGHAFVQNIRRGHYDLGVDTDPRNRLPAAFTELARAICSRHPQPLSVLALR
jgi:IS6 family transposase